MRLRPSSTSETVAHFLGAAGEDSMFRYLSRLVLLDRYQASDGIQEAAEAVAGWGSEAGLLDVSLEQHPADGTARWWSFDAPVSWTPTRAILSLVEPSGDHRILVDHGREPFSLATYSAATPRGGAIYRLARWGEGGDLNGSVVALPAGIGPGPAEAAALLSEAGAAGFITDAVARQDCDGRLQPGRIELAPGSRLFAFSVTPALLDQLQRREGQGAAVRIEIDVTRGAPMPVVSATLPGKEAEEIWIVSHLCHPRPGANDNGSGVAASLGLAQALAEARSSGLALSKTVRFIWGPEFLGTAASLRNRPRPCAVLNLDMVGEDQSLCESPFILELAPDAAGSLINPLAENAVGEAFRQTGRHGGVWKASPFLGFSDHALFADASIASPAVQFCHPADRFNHSAADTLDKVSGVELKRTVAAAAALLFDLDSPLAPPLRAFVTAWCARAHGEAEQVASRASFDEAWGNALRRHTERYCAALLGASDPLAVGTRLTDPPDPGAPRRMWEGPFNARAMVNALDEATRQDIRARIAADKRFLSLLVNFGLRVDGRHSRARIAEHVGFAAGHPLEPATVERAWSAFEESGFIG